MSERGILSGLKRCTRTSEKYDSSWERDYMQLLEDDPTVKRWERCRKLRIPYVNSAGKKSMYNPDFIIERTDGAKELHEGLASVPPIVPHGCTSSSGLMIQPSPPAL